MVEYTRYTATTKRTSTNNKISLDKVEENKAFFAWLKAIDQEQIIFRYKSLISLVEEKEQECVNNDYVNKQNKNSDKLAFFYKELESK